ncbi:MAG: hypothetical protein ACRDHZ_18705 [Ktedonobacteraceae bacterium]
MAYRATLVSQDPLEYLMEHDEDGPRLHIADVVLRINNSIREVAAHLIRIATNSKWSHSALVYVVNSPPRGLRNTFLIEAQTQGINFSSWRNEVMPFKEFTVGIKRPKLDWYIENAHEKAKGNPYDQENRHGISYLQHVREVAVDQIHGLYDHKVVGELACLYAERVARRHLGKLPLVAQAAHALADVFKKWGAKNDPRAHVMHFMCSGLVQYSFFTALRYRILHDLHIPEYRENALHNLRNMQRVLYRSDQYQVMSMYIRRLLAEELDLADPVPSEVLDLLKTATPADFNNSPNLEWRYMILNGNVWQIDEAPTGYVAQSKDEAGVLAMLRSEHHPHGGKPKRACSWLTAHN